MIVVAKKHLVKALERCAKIAPAKSPFGVYAHVCLTQTDRGLEYQAVDGTVSVRGVIPSKGTLESFTANAADLFGRAQTVLGDEVKLTVKKGKVTLSGDGKRAFTQQTLDSGDFPKSSFACAKRVELPGPIVRTLMSRVAFAISQDETRPHMSGTRVTIGDGKIKATCTNGHAIGMASADFESDDKLEVIIPGSGCRAMLSSDAQVFSLGADADAIYVNCDEEETRISALATQFPPVEMVIDGAKTTASALVNASTLIDSIAAIRRAGDNERVSISISPNELTITSERGDSQSDGTDTVSAATEAKGSFALNANYLVGALKSCKSASICFTPGESLDPIKVEDDGFLAVIMPIRS